MKKNIVIILIVIAALLIYIFIKPKQSMNENLPTQESQSTSYFKNDATCPQLSEQEMKAYTSSGKPIPGKYQFVLDFKQDEIECVGGSFGGDFMQCSSGKENTVTKTYWRANDVVNACSALYIEGGWAIKMRDFTGGIPLKYVKKVPDATIVTE